MLTTTSEVKFYIFDPKGKIVQNIKFLFVSQNSDLTLNLNPNHQHDSKSMLGFQNKEPDTKLLKFYANQGNQAYIEKHNF